MIGKRVVGDALRAPTTPRADRSQAGPLPRRHAPRGSRASSALPAASARRAKPIVGTGGAVGGLLEVVFCELTLTERGPNDRRLGLKSRAQLGAGTPVCEPVEPNVERFERLPEAALSREHTSSAEPVQREQWGLAALADGKQGAVECFGCRVNVAPMKLHVRQHRQRNGGRGRTSPAPLRSQFERRLSTLLGGREPAGRHRTERQVGAAEQPNPIEACDSRDGETTLQVTPGRLWISVPDLDAAKRREGERPDRLTVL